jgi:hypothetical protein
MFAADPVRELLSDTRPVAVLLQRGHTVEEP